MEETIWEKYKRKFLYWRPVRKTLYASKKLILPGFQGVSLYNVTSFFIQGLMHGAITQRAAALSFSFFLALFPAILFFFSLIPYFRVDHLYVQIQEYLSLIIPDAIYPAVWDTVEGIMFRKHTSLLSFGFLAALYFSTNGMDAIIKAFNQTTHAIETRKFIKRKLICLMFVILTALLVVVTFSFLIGFKFGLEYLTKIGFLTSSFLYYVLSFSKWIVIIGLTFITVSSIYYFAPAGNTKFKFFSVGSILATILFILLSIGFNIYINNFSRYNALYGSIGTLIIVLLWIYFNSIILLIGFELNASIAGYKSQISNKIQAFNKQTT